MVLSDEVAVVHEGRILQVAAPEAIYTRPASRTVAAFFGTPNLLDAKAREVRPAAGESTARVGGDGWEGWCAVADGVQPGDAVTVVVRPETLQFAREAGTASGAGISWSGIVRQRFFRGSRHVYTVAAGPLEFTVDAPPDQAVAPGTEVTLRVDAAHAWALRA